MGATRRADATTGDGARAAERPRPDRAGPGSRRLALLGIAAPLTLFCVLAATAARNPPGALDRAIFSYLYAGESDWALGPTPGRDAPVLRDLLPQLMRLNDDREVAVLVLLGLAVLLVARRFRAIVFAVAVFTVAVTAPLLKSLFDRGSPFPLPGQNAFPSGHAIGSMAVAGAIVVLAGGLPRAPAVALRVLAAALVLAIGVAVIADGGHWLTDVVAGWSIAVAWVSAVVLVVRHRFTDGRPAGRWLMEARPGRLPGRPPPTTNRADRADQL